MIRHTVIIDNRVLLVILLITLPLTLNCNKRNEVSQADTLDLLFHSGNVKLIRQVPLEFSTYHVQGLDITEQFYFVTSVDTEQDRAWLFKIDRQNGDLVSKKELTDGALIHPGGLQYDGRLIWVPRLSNASYPVC